MVDYLFELSRIDSGSFNLRREFVDPLDLVSDGHVGCPGGCRATRHSVTATRHRGLHPLRYARIDPLSQQPSRQRQPARSRRFEILITATTGDDGNFVLGILDHGARVSIENLEHVFEVGWRGDAQCAAESDYWISRWSRRLGRGADEGCHRCRA